VARGVEGQVNFILSEICSVPCRALAHRVIILRYQVFKAKEFQASDLRPTRILQRQIEQRTVYFELAGRYGVFLAFSAAKRLPGDRKLNVRISSRTTSRSAGAAQSPRNDAIFRFL